MAFLKCVECGLESPVGFVSGSGFICNDCYPEWHKKTYPQDICNRCRRRTRCKLREEMDIVTECSYFSPEGKEKS